MFLAGIDQVVDSGKVTRWAKFESRPEQVSCYVKKEINPSNKIIGKNLRNGMKE